MFLIYTSLAIMFAAIIYLAVTLRKVAKDAQPSVNKLLNISERMQQDLSLLQAEADTLQERSTTLTNEIDHLKTKASKIRSSSKKES